MLLSLSSYLLVSGCHLDLEGESNTNIEHIYSLVQTRLLLKMNTVI